MPAQPLEDLRLIALDDLVLHETTESARADRVRSEIARAGLLADPVVVTPTGDGRWLVLDGAHRTAALRSLGLRAVVVQEMALSPHGARLDSWSHDLPVGSVPPELASPGPVGGPALVATVEHVHADGGWSEPVAVTGPAAASARAAVTATVAHRYAGLPYSRSVPGTPARRGSGARVTWQPWSPSDLLELVAAGIVLPAGTTRFVLPGRVLGVRVGLSALADLPTAQTQSVIEALRGRAVRTYTELVHVVEAGS